MEYDYGNDIKIFISLKGKFVDPHFSQKFSNSFKTLINFSEVFLKTTGKRNTAFMSSSDIIAYESERRIFLKNIEEFTYQIFQDQRDLIFIPAGRSLLSTLSEQLQNIHPRRIDYLMRSFLDRINNSKAIFNKSLGDIVEEKKKLTQEKINFEQINLAQEIIRKILKADYRYDSDGEKL